MLPVFAKSKRASLELFVKVVGKAAIAANPILGKIKIRHQKEGHQARISDNTGGQSEIDYKKLHVQTSYKPDAMRGMTLNEFIEQAALLGKQLAKKQTEMIFAGINKACQTPNTSSKAINVSSFEGYLTLLKSLDYNSFDENGMPKGQTLIVAPGSPLPARIREWENDPKKMAEIKAVFKNKHNEQLQREADRGLAD
jgi:hypothetical protein